MLGDIFNRKKVAELEAKIEEQKNQLEGLQNKLDGHETFFDNIYFYAGNYPVWKAQQEFRESAEKISRSGQTLMHFKCLDEYLSRLVDSTCKFIQSHRPKLFCPPASWSDGLSEARGDDYLFTMLENKSKPQVGEEISEKSGA